MQDASALRENKKGVCVIYARNAGHLITHASHDEEERKDMTGHGQWVIIVSDERTGDFFSRTLTL